MSAAMAGQGAMPKRIRETTPRRQVARSGRAHDSLAAGAESAQGRRQGAAVANTEASAKAGQYAPEITAAVTTAAAAPDIRVKTTAKKTKSLRTMAPTPNAYFALIEGEITLSRLQRWMRPFPRFLIYRCFSATARTRGRLARSIYLGTERFDESELQLKEEEPRLAETYPRYNVDPRGVTAMQKHLHDS
jgi:hypothetical protein